MSVCLSARISQKPRVQISQNFSVHITAARRSALLCYVLPFHGRRQVFAQWSQWARIEDDAYVSSIVRQVAAPGAKSLSTSTGLLNVDVSTYPAGFVTIRSSLLLMSPYVTRFRDFNDSRRELLSPTNKYFRF